MSRVVLKNW